MVRGLAYRLAYRLASVGKDQQRCSAQLGLILVAVLWVCFVCEWCEARRVAAHALSAAVGTPQREAVALAKLLWGWQVHLDGTV